MKINQIIEFIYQMINS